MKPKTEQNVLFIKQNHKDFDGKLNGAEVANALQISQGRVSQLLKEIKEQNKLKAEILNEVSAIGQEIEGEVAERSAELAKDMEFAAQEAGASTAEA